MRRTGQIVMVSAVLLMAVTARADTTLVVLRELEAGRLDRAELQIARARLRKEEADLLDALLLLRAGQPGKAAEHLSPYSERAAARAELLFVLGVARLENEDAEGAAAVLKAALERDPASWPAHEALGRALFRLERPADAADNFREAARLCERDRERSIILANLGVARIRSGEIDQAIEALGSARSIAAPGSDAWRRADALLSAVTTVREGLDRLTRKEKP